MKKLLSIILALSCISSLFTVSAYEIYLSYDENGVPQLLFPYDYGNMYGYEIQFDYDIPIEEVYDEPIVEEEPVDEYDEYDFWGIPTYKSKYSTEGTNLRSGIDKYSSSYTITWNQHPDAVKYTVYTYNSKSGKYSKYDSGKYSDGFFYGTFYFGDLDQEKTYKVMLREYDKKDKVITNEKISFTTGSAAPKLVVSNKSGGKPKVKVTTDSKKATGVEIYYKVESASQYYTCYDFYSGCTLSEVKSLGFKLLKSSNKPSASVTLKSGKSYTLIARTFYEKNGKKIYSPFTNRFNSSLPEAYVNGLTLKSKTVTSGEELKLVKKYVDSAVNKNMTNAEKLSAIFWMVNSHGEYQNDIYKIDGNRPVWQIMEKQEGQCASWAYCLYDMLEYAGFDVKVVRGLRDSGQQHFWCQIKLNGKWYNLDAHLGSFLSEYKTDYIGYKIVD